MDLTPDQDPDDVSIVIVNWNSGRLLSECIDSLASIDRGMRIRPEIIVVDNASQDDSHACISSSDNVALIQNQENRGFAAACNQGAAATDGSLILFLNPDCRVGLGSVEAAACVLREQPDVGVVGVALRNDRGEVWRSCFRFPQPVHLYARAIGLAQMWPAKFDSGMISWPHDADRDVDHVIGAFYMMRRSLFERLGGFDERFYVYLEDLDLSLRVKALGFRTRFLAGPASYHKGGGTSERAKAMRIFLSTQSRILYVFKHFGPVHGWAHLAATLGFEPWCRLAMLLWQGHWRGCIDVWVAFKRLACSLPATLARRRPDFKTRP